MKSSSACATAVDLEDGPAHFDEIAVISRGGGHSWFRVVIREGRSREVRRMWEATVGLMVSRLRKRIRYAVELLACSKARARAPVQARSDQDLAQRLAGQPERSHAHAGPGHRPAPQLDHGFRPDPKSQAWTGTRTEEAREFGRIRPHAR
ncbi:hypothetical protein [Dokdonella sp.]|uniref:hypothetical protein n=1 Tax=Dokdonella sp. TaxID=2291710 RepID=UPI003528D049